MCPKSKEEFQEIREARREDIEQAALKCFASNGYHATTISHIAKEAGISKGLMYNYFTSKDELLSVLFLKFSEEIMQRLDPDNNQFIDDREAEEFVDKYLDFIEEKREYCKLFIQISVQPGILEMLMQGEVGKKAMKNQIILNEYFTRLSKGNAEVDMIFFTSLIKGFTLQYVFAPEMITKAQIRGIKEMLLVILNRKRR
jgi:AcrR family transcriptional regulator